MKREHLRAVSIAALAAIAVALAGCEGQVASKSVTSPTTSAAPRATAYPAATPPRIAVATSTPGATPTSGSSLDAAIVVASPRSGETITSPVRVTGTASVFEATLSVRVKDSTGKVVGQGRATASLGAPGRGTFTVDIPFDGAGSGVIEAYTNSPRDGKESELVSVPVILGRR